MTVGFETTPADFIRSACSGVVKNPINASLDGAVPITTALLGSSKFLCACAINPTDSRAFFAPSPLNT